MLSFKSALSNQCGDGVEVRLKESFRAFYTHTYAHNLLGYKFEVVRKIVHTVDTVIKKSKR